MELEELLKNRRSLISIIGLGYVGLPLVLRFGEVGFKILARFIHETFKKYLNYYKSLYYLSLRKKQSVFFKA